MAEGCQNSQSCWDGTRKGKNVDPLKGVRPEALVNARLLESKGNVKRWRYSEVRRPASPRRKAGSLPHGKETSRTALPKERRVRPCLFRLRFNQLQIGRKITSNALAEFKPSSRWPRRQCAATRLELPFYRREEHHSFLASKSHPAEIPSTATLHSNYRLGRNCRLDTED